MYKPRPKFNGSSSARYVKNTRGSRPQGQQGQDPQEQLQSRFDAVREIDRLDGVFGFDRFENGPKRTGWLINMHPTTIITDEYVSGYSGVDYYFLDEEGGSFKATVQFDPYFLLAVQAGREPELEEALKKNLESTLKTISRVTKEDLSLPNHLIGLRGTFLKVTFHNVNDLIDARRLLMPIITQNKANKDKKDIYTEVNYKDLNNDDEFSTGNNGTAVMDAMELIEDIREYDVPYHARVSIDENLRVGKWYTVEAQQGHVTLTENVEKIAFADPVILAFDIETTKSPLKFPDSSFDQIMMISYMIDGDGYLITNREIISKDIEDFEYTPKPEFPGMFTVFNEADEKSLIEKFFEHVRDCRPTVIATFNGDFFDWPFVEARAAYHGIDMFKEIGFAKDNEGEYKSSYCVHMDCYRWVKRDSYLPQGSQGLKAVTTVKLGYNPIELDPELMTPYAYEEPQILSEYSVSDAVATYYLYYKYVHPFVFSLCSILPLNPDETLRKGTGTLCEMLLMVQAFQNGIAFPNKHTDPLERFYNGHLLESETYVGGHVESLEAGVFRSDIPNHFNVDPTAIEEIMGDLDNALKFAITVEEKKKVEDVVNYDEIYEQIRGTLENLKENPKRFETPLIYHVDVASMYPNIMTSNRLQPDSIKSEEDCSACDFNRPGKNCARVLPWSWRGEFYPADYKDYSMIKRSLENEPGFENLHYNTKVAKIKKRLEDYSKKVYHRIKATEEVQRDAIICQRENPFYVNTVSGFRDRRYHFKTLAKVWKGKASQIDKSDAHAKDEAKKMIILYDSLQLAHKVILNSFYGYVMRKGSRWYSMEMAGVTCLTGSTIIQMARGLVERLGRPLELDTDGIWCILPSSFPEDFTFKLKDGKKISVSYPCSMLNYIVHQRFTNHQYQELVDPERLVYETHSENSIFFEVDGPYKAMILPTSKEEGKGLKKRYAVFNDDGSLAELKGFELKRRGELQLIKNFQQDIFKLFLDGHDLESCYGAVANVANRWLDVLDTKGAMLEDEDLIELICENRSMSKTLAEYGSQKSTSITTAKRLGEFLGEEMVKDKGLACKYIIACKPANAPITERAIPVAIFSSELSVKRQFLKRWLMDNSLEDFDPRTILDWGYYKERLASVVQKIITIPAALQDVRNPVPRIPHPEWLRKKIAVKDDKMKQGQIGNFFSKVDKQAILDKQIKDIEDIGNEDAATANLRPKYGKVLSKKRKLRQQQEEEAKEAEVILSGKCPDPEDDYIGFLKYQKKKWDQASRQQKTRTRLFGSQQQTSSAGAIGNMFKERAERFATSTWEILEYKRDPSNPGDIKAYVLVDGKIQNFTIHIPKKMYLNMKNKRSLPKMHDTAKLQIQKNPNSLVLPSGRKSNHLYRVCMDEAHYLEERKNPNSILNDNGVDSIYEEQIQSIERAIIELGSSVRFDETQIGALGKAMEHGFAQDSLQMLDSSKYLNRFGMELVYLLHLVSNQYEFFALFKKWDNEVQIFVLKPSNSAQELPQAQLEKLYKDAFAQKRDKISANYHIIDYKDDLQFETVYFTDLGKLYRKLNNVIAKVSDEKATRPLFLLQSPHCDKMGKLLRAVDEFPVVKLHVNELTLPALNWQSLVIKRMMNHYLLLANWVKKLIDLSRYGNIPLCNLQIQDMGYMIDVEYARRLQKNNIVLWWSSNPLPDHGGAEKDYSAEMSDDLLEFPTINRPEMYENVSLEMDLGNLTINSLLASALINEAEGTDLAEQELEHSEHAADPGSASSSSMTTFAEDTFPTASLTVLRTLVKEWWDGAIKDNTNADSMVHSFISWVQNSRSFLYDPALQYHVHNVTKKVWLQLLGEFKRSGANIIFANRNKIIIKTSKSSVENSYAYGQYVVKAIRSKPLFNYVDLQVVRYWDLLIWMDQYNYCGRGCREISSSEKQQLEGFSNWHIKNFLPISLQPEFEDWIIIILDSLIKEHEKLATSSPRVTQINQILQNRDMNKLSSPGSAGAASDGTTTAITDMLSKPMEKRFVQLIRLQNQSVLDAQRQLDYEFPKLPGSHLKMTNPTLELFKSLMQILALSKRRNIEVRVLRKAILQLFDVKEFNEAAVFHNPSASLRILHVLCEYCNHLEDIDFCKDDNIWACSRCQKSFNKVVIEEKLAESLIKLVNSYYTQDLKCSKCGTIRVSSIQDHCSCSGTFVELLPKREVVKRIQTFENVSNFYDLKLLRDVIDELAV